MPRPRILIAALAMMTAVAVLAADDFYEQQLRSGKADYQATRLPQAADELMRAPREDLHGRNLADLFATGKVQTVIRLILSAADQS